MPLTNIMKLSSLMPSTRPSGVMLGSTGSVPQHRSTENCVVLPRLAKALVAWVMENGTTIPSADLAARPGSERTVSNSEENVKVFNGLCDCQHLYTLPYTCVHNKPVFSRPIHPDVAPKTFYLVS